MSNVENQFYFHKLHDITNDKRNSLDVINDDFGKDN